VCKIERDGKVIKSEECPEGDCSSEGKKIKHKGMNSFTYRFTSKTIPCHCHYILVGEYKIEYCLTTFVLI
jgi:hypothetical protein